MAHRNMDPREKRTRAYPHWRIQEETGPTCILCDKTAKNMIAAFANYDVFMDRVCDTSQHKNLGGQFAVLQEAKRMRQFLAKLREEWEVHSLSVLHGPGEESLTACQHLCAMERVEPFPDQLIEIHVRR